MTLGRLMELYQAEQQGKQIIKRTTYHGHYIFREYTTEVKLKECELEDLVLGKQKNTSVSFEIKDECKL